MSKKWSHVSQRSHFSGRNSLIFLRSVGGSRSFWLEIMLGEFLAKHCRQNLMLEISDYFRSCAECGSGRFPLDVLCKKCWSEIYFSCRLTHRSGLEREGETFDLFSHFVWKNDSVKTLIHALKGGNHRSAFRKIAFEFSNERSKIGAIEKIIFVPAPPRVDGEVDHAHLWAAELANYWGAPLFTCLKRGTVGEQKHLSKIERSKKRLELVKNLKGRDWGQSRIVFCDDVYTTGATARAAFHALGQPPAFEVWTVACRPKLFGV